MFVCCLHRLNYSSVGLSFLTSCAKVPGSCPAWCGQVVRWCWMNFPVPGRLTNLDENKTRAYCACSGCGWGLFGNLFSRLSFLFLSPILWETARYRLKYCLKGPLNPNNQPTNCALPQARFFSIPCRVKNSCQKT